jgi:hypothetical protein
VVIPDLVLPVYSGGAFTHIDTGGCAMRSKALGRQAIRIVISLLTIGAAVFAASAAYADNIMGN